MDKNNINIANTNMSYDIYDSSTNAEGIVTTGQFVAMIIGAIKGNSSTMAGESISEYMDYALNKGIIEDYDIGNTNYPIERRALARIAHEVLLSELGEKDENDWSAANNLQDLYVCRTCVMHIAQMYVKGIIQGRDNNMFDVKGKTDYTEASAIVERLLDREKRTLQTDSRVIKYEKLSPQEAWELTLKDHTAMMIDVRTAEEYRTGYIEGSICIPLNDISKNPYAVCQNRNAPIILYCKRGYMSTVAASILIDAGYSSVYTIPGIEEHKYNLINDEP